MITIKLSGRLGNQMFQYSVCRAAANRRGYNFFISDEMAPSTEGQHIKNYFNNLNLGKKDGDVMHVYSEDFTIQRYSDEVFKIFDFTELRGFFQTPKYFQNIKSDIKDWFEIKNFQETKSFYEKYNVENHCIIHLRASDYKNHGHVFLKKDYYEKAMKTVKDSFSNVTFLIVTEDLDSAKSMFPEIECFSHSNMMVDFEILYKSKINIIPNSTFSWWASWLDNKEMVVAPNNWWNYNTPELGFYPVDIKTEEFIYV